MACSCSSRLLGLEGKLRNLSQTYQRIYTEEQKRLFEEEIDLRIQILIREHEWECMRKRKQGLNGRMKCRDIIY
jgi:hypothetical protein